jgi:tetraacyldisaccharide 4'-kinase
MRRPWLAPLIPLYAGVVAARNLGLKLGWEPVRHLRWPVISVGNLSTGGAGKTPFAIALAQMLAAKGFSVDILSRGYGRQNNQPAGVRSEGSVDEFGDEPLLIARETGVPVYVASKRYDAGLLAELEFDTAVRQNLREDQIILAHILDDGFQHQQLAREVDILLLNRGDWEDALLPAGNLREGLHAVNRASILAIPAEEPGFESQLRVWGWTKPIWRLHRRMEVPHIDGPVAAFCGIAQPEQFYDGLEDAGLLLAEQTTFRDHHRYTAHEVHALVAAARSVGATALITTEKDAVRLGNLVSGFPAAHPLKTARLHIEIEDLSAVIGWLVNRLLGRPTIPSL